VGCAPSPRSVRVLERALELEVPALQLLVERRQLFVARLQLLLRRLQLSLMLCSSSLAERTSSFEACSSSLAASCCSVTAWRYCVASRAGVSGSRSPSPRRRARAGAAARGRRSSSWSRGAPRRARAASAPSRGIPGAAPLQVQPADVAPVTQRHALLADRGVFLPGFLDCPTDLKDEPLARHLEQVEARPPLGVLQVRLGLAAELDDVVLPVHDHAGGCVPRARESGPLPWAAPRGGRASPPPVCPPALSTTRPRSAENEGSRGGGGRFR